MKQGLKNIIKILSAPLALLAAYLFVLALWRVLGLPKEELLIEATKTWFNQYGLWVVFLSAIAEGVLILGQYYPGGLVIFLGVIAAGHDVPKIIQVVAVVSLSFFIGYSLDYFIGRYGWYKLFLRFGLKKSLDKAQSKLQKHELSAVIFSYWEPNLASITATAAGTLQVPLVKFSLHSAIGIILWNIFWGTLVASLGAKALRLIGLKWVLIIFFAWVLILLVKHYAFDQRRAKQLPPNLP